MNWSVFMYLAEGGGKYGCLFLAEDCRLTEGYKRPLSGKLTHRFNE